MENLAGWLFFMVLATVNIVMFILIDGYFEGDIAGLVDED